MATIRFGVATSLTRRSRRARLVRSLAFAVIAGVVSAGTASAAVRVVGGTTIQIEAAPWSVYVVNHLGSTDAVCTGSVIDASHILTAAHCLEESGAPAQPASVEIVAGVSNLSAATSGDLEQDRSTSSLRVHPGFVGTGSGAADDVAVVALAAPLDLGGPAVQAVALPAPNMPFPAGAALSVAGFGLQDAGAKDASGALVSMTTTADSQGECGDLTHDELMLVTNAVVFCAVSPTSAVCHGDSGSGVVTTGGTPLLVGVTDAGDCRIGGHGIFAYVGAPEILRFIEGDDQPPAAPRPSLLKEQWGLTWRRPLVVGDTLRCSTADWPAPLQVGYQFVNTVDGDVLQTGPNARYVVPAAAVGMEIVCKVAVTNDGGTSLISGSATPKIGPASPVEVGHLAPVAGSRGHEVTLHVVLLSRPGLSGTLNVCAVLPASAGGRVCRSLHKPFGTVGNIRFTLTLRIKPTAPLGVVRVAISARAPLSTDKTTALLRISKS
jgi:hypothetical protein